MTINGKTPIPEAISQFQVEKAARECFHCLIENNLSEAEVVSTVAMTLAMRLAYSSQTIEDLEVKLKKFPEIFTHYARLNLQAAQNAMLQKAEQVKDLH